MSKVIKEVQRLGQSIWIDYLRRGMLESGELARLIEEGVSGLTSNPTIFEKAIAGSTDYDAALLQLVRAGKSTRQIYETLTVADIRAAADRLRPVYDGSGGADGYVSLEVDPNLAHDTKGTIEEARRLFSELERPNVMIKVPATPEGLPAVRQLISEGININVTLIFSLEMYRQVREAYLAGLEALSGRGGNLSRVASVASFFLSRVDTMVDSLLEERIRNGQTELSPLLGKTATSNAKMAYQAFKDTFGSQRFAVLKARGARGQRPLWASTSTKNPAYHDLMYVSPLIGPDTVNTLPPVTIDALRDHGQAENTLELDVPEAKRTLETLEAHGISMERVTARLLEEGIRLFATSFQKLLDNIEEKKRRLTETVPALLSNGLGQYQDDVNKALKDLAAKEVVARLWRQDHTVWQPEPAEITNRLGWLSVSEMMSGQVPNLVSFAGEVRGAGFKNVVLLGMGGSSLGPEVLRQAFGPRQNYPALMVLDSTVPARVQAVKVAINPARTLFLVSSKSGGTVETLSLYRYFRKLVERALGQEAGQNFVAITDPGTSLEQLARESGFRRAFLNPADIGGRYSVLSYFGLVPAVLSGLDIKTLLERAERVRESTSAGVPVRDNPGAWLGAVMGTLALGGRDKLTLLTSPAIAGFGLWAEQLIAESTGKDGKGIVPVAAEPLMSPPAYGADRLFVYLRLKDDDNAEIDAALAGIRAAGQPLVTLELNDRYDLGAEFYRWEFAVAVAGAILGINPFNQPDVQAAKDATARVLAAYQENGHLSPVASGQSPQELLARVTAGKYLAVMAYLNPTPAIEGALTALRRRVTERYHIAATLGYGPRFLHSTGQLHKGGPDSGLFLQITARHHQDLPVPGAPYTFGVLADAQARGDLQALRSRGRPVVSVRLDEASEKAIRELAERLG